MRSHLLNDATAESYRRSVTEGVERVARKLATTRRPFTGVTPAALAPTVAAVDLDKPLGDSSAALDELESVYLRDAVYFHHPRYLGHLNCPVVIPAVLGEAVLSAVNSSLDTWDQSAGGTLIERKLIDWTNGRIGFEATNAPSADGSADGVFTSGGSQSNLQALLLAREEAKTSDLSKLRVFTSDCSHFSVQKSAGLLGLGPDAVISIPVDRTRRMQSVVLAAELEACRAEGLTPMAIVATAGTTDFGSIDPLHEIAALADEYGAWMHVDAAYGCGLLASRTRRHLLDGIERADSVTVDFHKSFFQPVSSSALLVRDGATLRHATYHADYLNPLPQALGSARAGGTPTVAEQIPNQVDKSLQTTRRFDALKLWMTLRVMGADGVGELFDEVCDLAAAGFELLAADPRYDVVVQPQLSTLVYRYIPEAVTSPAEIDRANLYARKALFASGEAVVAGTKVDGRQYLKFTLLNPETTVPDIAAVLDLIAGHAEQYLGETLVHAAS
ncbi:aspartate aminotransferase family protein [Streptomyces sp. P9(2023)]|uniref:pyridoxal phosphate-dependent decarboxylase family protein n=1 Tax=Streptomyces sp. P9(2023) TaxID=3064394 RepID=UPI0028F454D6|nr:aspartate aminotransferase family protein [Streptomyces sp. P9(2023)]MDT9689173.1 aspartate aminotransferase family protein [Streptomyces sp. P9(2023)]